MTLISHFKRVILCICPHSQIPRRVFLFNIGKYNYKNNIIDTARVLLITWAIMLYSNFLVVR